MNNKDLSFYIEKHVEDNLFNDAPIVKYLHEFKSD